MLKKFDWGKFNCFLKSPIPPKDNCGKKLAYSVMVKIG